MDQQKKKSKKVIKALFVILAILVLALIGAIVYFSLTGDFFKEEEVNTVTCGCYYIDPQVTSTCGDTQRAFKFNTAQGTLQDCSASCPLTDLSTNMLYSTTPQDSYKVCSTRSIPNTTCNAMEIKTENGLIVTGKIQPDETITVTATFDSDQYTNHEFIINSVPTQPDTVNGNTITKTLSDFGDSSTLQISARATTTTGDSASSIICNRLVEVTTTAKAGVSELTLDSYTENNVTKLRSAIISAGGLQDTTTTVKFTFQDNTLAMTDGFEIDPDRGRISITEAELYDSTNFSTSNSFELLSQYEGDVDITVEVIQDGNSLGTATSKISLVEKTTEDTGKDNQSSDQTDQTDTTDESTESSFTVSKESSETCVERVSPDNSSTFTITVKNTGDIADTIESIKDKLPLGFTYVASSSKLNNESIADSVFVTTTNVGDSQEIVWKPQSSWSIGANGTLIITFDAIAGNNAISGENLNEVIITPTEIPTDPSTLRSSASLTVAQDCDNITDEDNTPQTGIFDTTIGRISVGIGIILLGIIIYNTHQGNRLAHMIINSGAYKGAEMTSYKIFNPKKYFEEKILERRERKR